MPRITQELLRKRAEHNECMLSTLEEVSLHQQDLERIENLDVYCRNLKILYLQSNLIPKMEGLHKLKKLEYVNLAVNNISKIEGIRGCESLAKIDLTLNFVDIEDLEESMDNVAECEEMKELYMTGNPCVYWPGYKEYVMAKVTQIRRLDGEDVTKSQRLAAKQKLKVLEQQLRIDAQANIEKKSKEEVNKDAYSKETRIQIYEEMQEKKRLDDQNMKDNSMFKEYKEFDEMNKNKEPLSVYNNYGDIRQCNEGKYEFKFTETQDKTCIVLEVYLPKFMDTSLIKVDLNPLYVRLDIKGKITQFKFTEDILVDKSKIQRSQTTGILMFTMPKSNLTEHETRNMRVKSKEEEKKKEDKLKNLDKQLQEGKKQIMTAKQYEDKQKDGFTIREVTKEELMEREAKTKKVDFIPDFNVDEVPDLE